MSPWEGQRRLQVLSAVMRADGTPTFAVNEVDATYEQFANGVHYYLVEADFLEQGFEEPYVHFDDTDLPVCLVEVIKEYLAARWAVPDLVTEVPGEMLMPRIIEVTVSAKGETTVQTKGYVGGDCLQASKFLEQSLGVARAEQKTTEFYQAEPAQQEVNQ